MKQILLLKYYLYAGHDVRAINLLGQFRNSNTQYEWEIKFPRRVLT